MTVFGHKQFPSLGGATEWLNSAPLDPAALRGHVVLVNFWTLTCINWLRRCRELMGHIGAYRENQAQSLEQLGVSMWSAAAGLQRTIDDPPASGRVVAAQVSLVMDLCQAVTRVLSDGFREVWDLAVKDGGHGAVIVEGRDADRGPERRQMAPGCPSPADP